MDAGSKSGYIPYGVTLTQGQKENLAKATRDGVGVTIRLPANQLHGEDKLGLTKRQLAHITKKKSEGAGIELKFSKTQMKRMTKMGGILPLFALLPMLFGGLSAAGALAGGAAGVAKTVLDKQTASAAQAEVERHNRKVEAQLKGSGLYLGRQTLGGCCPMCRGSRFLKGSGLYLGRQTLGGCCPMCRGSRLYLSKN